MRRDLLILSVLAISLSQCAHQAPTAKKEADVAATPKPQPIAIGADQVRWNLTFLYKNIDDPRLEADMAELERLAKRFHDEYKGKLGTRLGAAIADYAELDMLSNQVFGYLARLGDLNLTDQKVKTKMADAQRRWSQAAGQYLTFFDLELAKLSQAAIDRQKTADPVVRKHMPMIRSARRDRPHMLTEPVEGALAKRSMYGPGSWADFYEEIEADLRFTLQGQDLTLEEILHVLSEDPDPDARAKALKSLNEGFRGYFAKYAAQTLNMISGSKAVEDTERHYAHPMAARNEGNAVDDRVVEALHTAVKDTAGPLARRYYRLKSVILGLPKMRWSDRNAKLPFSLKEGIPFDEAMGTVADAYQSFSPTLAKLVREIRASDRIDAPVVPGKSSGAYCSTLVLPGGKTVPLVLLNFQGSQRDVMTLAHELGHAVHGILAGEAQGALMAHAPMAYAETASVFGEMTTFNYLRAELEKSGDKRALLALLTSKIDDIINTSVRQISFSNFERRVHGAKRRLSVEELNGIWLEVTQEMYGQEGEVFTYADMEYLWAYISHFHRPFYVYSYAFGELLTHSLYAKRARLGAKFEPLYLELLRAGGTKNAVELLKPFGLDPRDPNFWSEGIQISLGAMIDEAEKLARELGYEL
jgi:oligoendopeptidase F